MASISWVKDEYQIFNYERSRAKRENPDGDSGLSAFQLLPETYDEDQDYIDKLICMIVAKCDSAEFMRLYYGVSYSEIWEMYALQKTASFQPPKVEKKQIK